MELQNLTPADFDAHVAQGTLRLAFVGMSNAGKSYRSKVLKTEQGFLWYCIDDEIRKSLGLMSVEEMSPWMGYPSNPGYKEREREYLELEDKATRHVLMQTKGKNLAFDTTGSVVHLAQGTLKDLRENCLVVHFEIDEGSVEKMVERFFAEPKPVAWCEYFDALPGETQEEALKRCYPLLLKERLARYKKLAHINVPVAQVRDTSGKETLEVIRRYLTI